MEGADDRGLALVAAAQRGMVHRSQLIELGIGRGSIAHRLRIGSLHRVLPSVFAVGHRALPLGAAEMAALLYARQDCVLSHTTAAAIWELGEFPTDVVRVTVAGRNVDQRPGLRIHRVPMFDSRDVRLRNGLPVTAPARTLIDLAALTSDDVVAGAVAQVRWMRLTSDRELYAAIARCPNRTGAARLKRVLRHEGEPALTVSRQSARV